MIVFPIHITPSCDSPYPPVKVYDDVVEDPYADTAGDDPTADITALTGVVNPNFPAMRKWIKEHISMVAKRVTYRIIVSVQSL